MQELICVYIYIIYISSYSHICMYSIIYSQSINPDYCDIFATKLWISNFYNFNLYNCRNMIYNYIAIHLTLSSLTEVLLTEYHSHYSHTLHNKFLLYFQNMNNVYNTFKDNYEYTECLGMPKYSCYPITFVYDSQRANDIIT